MGRPAGRRNTDFDRARADLLDRLAQGFLGSQQPLASFNEFAAVAGVSRATLRHYFGARDELVAAVLGRFREIGDALQLSGPQGFPDLGCELAWYVHNVVEAWRAGLGRVLSRGMAAGLGHPQLGPAYVASLLEPLLQKTEARLAAHVRAGRLGPGDPRHAALELISPAVLALLHQDALFGAHSRPLDVDAFVTAHVERFLRAWGPRAP